MLPRLLLLLLPLTHDPCIALAITVSVVLSGSVLERSASPSSSAPPSLSISVACTMETPEGDGVRELVGAVVGGGVGRFIATVADEAAIIGASSSSKKNSDVVDVMEVSTVLKSIVGKSVEKSVAVSTTAATVGGGVGRLVGGDVAMLVGAVVGIRVRTPVGACVDDFVGACVGDVVGFGVAPATADQSIAIPQTHHTHNAMLPTPFLLLLLPLSNNASSAALAAVDGGISRAPLGNILERSTSPSSANSLSISVACTTLMDDDSEGDGVVGA